MFVDLYGLTRQAVRVGTESYGLKALEAAFGFERNAELQGAIGSMRHWQDYQADQDPQHLHQIALYNEDDVRSTLALYGWLRALRPQAEARWNVTLSTLAPEPPKEPSAKQLALQARTETLRPGLLIGLPDDEAMDDANQRARRLAFDLVGYHAREAKPVWWAFFARRDRTVDQLRDEDSEAIGGLEVVERIDDDKAWIWTLRFPEQDYKLSPGGVDDPITGTRVELQGLDEAARTVTVRRSKKHGDGAPVALGPGGAYGTDAQVEAVYAFAERIAAEGLDRAEAGVDLLLRRPPRFAAGTPPLADEPVTLARLAQQVRGLDRSALVIQGPPGTGKTLYGCAPRAGSDAARDACRSNRDLPQGDRQLPVGR